MKPKTALFTLLSVVAVPLLQATAPLYSIKITPTKTFELVTLANSGERLDLYHLTEGGAMASKGQNSRKVIAAGYATGFAKIKTEKPSLAVQEILNQIGQQTGLMLRKHFNSSLSLIAPTTLLQGFSETAVVTLVLTPKEQDVYLATCAYTIYERPEGSIDGTSAAIAQQEEMMRLLSADSTATSLPAKAVLKDIRPGEYFRGAMGSFAPDSNGEFFPIVVLMLKKGDDFSLGYYRNNDGVLTMLDEPVSISGTKPPFVTNLPTEPPTPAGTPLRLSQVRMGYQANKVGGTGGYYISLENGRVVKKEF